MQTSPDSAVIDADVVLDNARVGRLNVLVAVLSGTVLAVDGFDTQAIGVVAPQLVKLWHIQPALLGYMFSSALVGLMIGYLLIAPLSGKFGLKRVTIGCCLFFGVLTIASVTATTPWELMAYRLLTGIGLGGAIPPAVALCGEYAPESKRSTYITWMYCGFSLGQIGAGVVAAGLLETHGWQSVLIVGGVLPVLHAGVLAWLAPESLEFMIARHAPQPRIAAVLRRIDATLRIGPATRIVVGARNSAGASVAKLFANRRTFGTLMIWLGLFMNLFVFYFFQNWLPTILVKTGLTAQQANIDTSIALAGGIPAALVIGPLMDRFGAYRVMTALFLAGGVFMASIGGALPVSQLATVLAGFCTGFCVAGIQKSTNALAVYFYPTSLRSTGLGWGLGIGRAGAILGPSIAGNLFAMGWDTSTIFYAAMLPMVVGAAALHVMGVYYRGGRAETLPARAAAE